MVLLEMFRILSLTSIVIDSHDIIGTALNASGGVASGKAAFSIGEAKEYRLAGVPCILVHSFLLCLSSLF